MTNNEFLKVLIPELKRLEEIEHLRDLIINGRYHEAKSVLDRVDYSSLEQYCDDNNDEKQHGLEVSDIPEEYLVTFMFYLWGSEQIKIEKNVMRVLEELQAAVEKQGEDGAIIARKMDYYYLAYFDTIAELMDPNEEDEEDEEDAVD